LIRAVEAYLKYQKFRRKEGMQQNSCKMTVIVEWAAFWIEIEDKRENSSSGENTSGGLLLSGPFKMRCDSVYSINATILLP
jgi:hypothetical protein